MNGYPWNVVNDIIKHALHNNDNNNTFNDNDIDAVRIYIKIKYTGETADRLIKQCMKKLYKCFKNEKRVNLFYNMKQLNYLIFLTQKIKFYY